MSLNPKDMANARPKTQEEWWKEEMERRKRVKEYDKEMNAKYGYSPRYRGIGEQKEAAGDGGKIKDSLVLVGFIALIVSVVPAIAIGAYFMNWIPIIYGLGVIGVLMAVAFSSNGGHHHDNSGLYEAAHYWRSSRGRAFRMWAANRRT